MYCLVTCFDFAMDARSVVCLNNLMDRAKPCPQNLARTKFIKKITNVSGEESEELMAQMGLS